MPQSLAGVFVSFLGRTGGFLRGVHPTSLFGFQQILNSLSCVIVETGGSKLHGLTLSPRSFRLRVTAPQPGAHSNI